MLRIDLHFHWNVPVIGIKMYTNLSNTAVYGWKHLAALIQTCIAPLSIMNVCARKCQLVRGQTNSLYQERNQMK